MLFAKKASFPNFSINVSFEKIELKVDEFGDIQSPSTYRFGYIMTDTQKEDYRCYPQTVSCQGK